MNWDDPFIHSSDPWCNPADAFWKLPISAGCSLSRYRAYLVIASSLVTLTILFSSFFCSGSVADATALEPGYGKAIGK
jgi:hypothetical protein